MKSILSSLESSRREVEGEHIARTNRPFPCRGRPQDNNVASRSLEGSLVCFSSSPHINDDDDDYSPPPSSSFVATASSRANNAWNRGAPESFVTVCPRTRARNSFAEIELTWHCRVDKCVASTHKFVPEQTVTVYAIEDIILSRMSLLNCL